MSLPSTNNFADVKNLFLNGSLGIQFTASDSDPTDVDLAAGRIYYNSVSGAHRWYNGTTWSTFGSGGGGGGTPSWATIYAAFTTFPITSGTWTITQSSNNALLTLSKTGAGAGSVISISNSGTGADIANGSTWSLAVAAAVGVLELSSGGTINAAGGALTIGKTATATTFAGSVVVTGGAGTQFTLSSGNAVLTSGNLTLTSGNAVLTSGTLTVSAGLSTFITASNTTGNAIFTDNTITTYGVGGTSTGMVLMRSTSLTTGTLLQVQASEAALSSGSYIVCWDATGGAARFSVGKFGATVIAGTAAGTAALTLTTGDAVISSGSVLITRATNNATVTVTNNSLTSASALSLTGSGAFTGTTTSSFFVVNASGLTTGTAAHLVTSALTTGTTLNLLSASNVLTSGSLLTATWNPAAVTSIPAGILWSLVDSPTYNATVAPTHNDLKIVRTNTTAAAVITVSPSGAVAHFENAAPSIGAGSTLTDSAKVVRILQSNTTGTGLALDVIQSAGAGATNAVAITANSVTTSSGVLTLTANGLTTGTAALITSSGVIATTGNLLSLVASGLTTGTALNLGTLAALTTGVGILLAHTTSVIADGGSLLRLSSSSIDTGGATNGTLLDLASTASTAGTLVKLNDSALTTGVAVNLVGSGVYAGTGFLTLTHNGLTTGTALLMTLNGLTTGKGLSIAHTTAVIASGGALVNISSTSIDTATTSGSLMNLSSTASAVGTQVLKTYSGLTSGIGDSIVAAALTTGIALKLSATAATLSTGFYLACNDGALNTFTVGANGHLTSNQTTAPTIAVTVQNGITAAAITAGSSDSAGNITTTGTNNNGGATVLTVTFNKTYTVAPKSVMLVPTNAAAVTTAANAAVGSAYISSVTATTFVVTIPPNASAQATPSWAYIVLA